MVTTESVGAIARARPNGIRGRANLCATSRSTQVIHGKPGHWKEMTVVPVEPRVPVSGNAPGSGRHSAGTWCVDLGVGLRAAIFTPFGTPIHHALGLIIAGVAFGFNLGLWFSVGMVILAAGAILYQTSNLVHKYREDQYVAAGLGLFASLMLLFWYILSILSRD